MIQLCENVVQVTNFWILAHLKWKKWLQWLFSLHLVRLLLCFLSTQKIKTHTNRYNIINFSSFMNYHRPLFGHVSKNKKEIVKKTDKCRTEMVWMTIRHGRSRKFPYFIHRITFYLSVLFSFKLYNKKNVIDSFSLDINKDFLCAFKRNCSIFFLREFKTSFLGQPIEMQPGSNVPIVIKTKCTQNWISRSLPNPINNFR